MEAGSPNLELHIGSTPEATASAAAKGIADAIRAAVKARGLCTLALSGGHSPAGMLAELARQRIPWESVHIFQVDERAAPAGSPDRNWTDLQSILLDHIRIPANNIHAMLPDSPDLDITAERYAAELAAVAGQPPVIDLVHLGLGHDGHTASLVPGDPVLGEVSKDVAVTGEYQGYQRLTLTYPCLRRARQLTWFVTGADKAAMLRRLQQNGQGIPAGRIDHDRNVVYADRAAAPATTAQSCHPVLSVDIGGSHVKLMDSVNRERRKFESGPELTAQQMCRQVLELAADWNYAAVSLGIPAPVRNHRPLSDPPNLGPGWADFDYAAAFGKPLKIMNDAAMQALGSYQGGKTLFLGLGTGLGAAMVMDKMILPMELAHLPYLKSRTFEDYLGERGLERLGKSKWREHAARVVTLLRSALLPEEVILGGGNVRHFDELPPGCRRGNNDDAFLGGFRLWENGFIEL
jgi:polyphosphate glucokinase